MPKSTYMKTPRHILPLTTAVLVAAFFFSSGASAQFRNNSVHAGVGPLVLGCASPLVVTALPVQLCGGNDDYQQFYAGQAVDGLKNDGWSATHQFGVNIGYSRALGYNLWLDTDVGVGMGSAVNVDSQRFGGYFQPVAGILGSVGIRYMFLDEEHRPFVLAYWATLFLPNTEGTSIRFNNIINQSLWMGPRVGAGYEWFFLPTLRRWGADIDIFFDEVSVQADAQAIVFIDIAGWPLMSQTGRLLFKIYF